MKTNKLVVARRILTGAIVALLSLSALSAVVLSPAIAHKGNCPFCDLPLVQGTKTQDNEVKMTYGRKRLEYRCVYCALSEAKSEYKGNVTIAAPSEKKGRPVVIKRTNGKWSVSPKTAVFVAQKVSHRYCHIAYRAFSSRAAFNAHVKKNAKLLKGAKPLTLTQMVAVAK